MYRKIALIGGTAAVIVGAGTAALATTGSSTAGSSPTSATSASPTGSSANAAALAKFAKRHPLLGRALARHVVHGQVVTKNGTTYTTHDEILGAVTAVSPTSISVKSSDGYVETFTLSSATKVRMRTNGKASASTIGAVHAGDTVAVTGVGTATPTARRIIDVQKG